jgi:hypothetical protein
MRELTNEELIEIIVELTDKTGFPVEKAKVNNLDSWFIHVGESAFFNSLTEQQADNILKKIKGLLEQDNHITETNFVNQLFKDEDGEFYLTLYPATNISADVFGNPKSEEMVVYYKVKDKSKVLVMRAIEFISKYDWHDPYPNLFKDFEQQKGE